MTRSISTLGDVTDAYDVILCDVWGVLQNGVKAYEAAGDALTRFRSGGGRVVLVSNAPRPNPSRLIVFSQCAGMMMSVSIFLAPHG